MAKPFAQLEYIEHDHKISWETDSAFLCCLQSSLLLALKEQGRLSEMQYRDAAARLEAQRQEKAKKLLRQVGEVECTK